MSSRHFVNVYTYSTYNHDVEVYDTIRQAIMSARAWVQDGDWDSQEDGVMIFLVEGIDAWPQTSINLLSQDHIDRWRSQYHARLDRAEEELFK